MDPRVSFFIFIFKLRVSIILHIIKFYKKNVKKIDAGL